MATTSQATSSTTETTTIQPIGPPETTNLVLRLADREPDTDAIPHVRWTADTVNNEGMGKKKSKCCCIYKKVKRWDESDTESENETEHCRGHVEKKPPGSGHGCGDDSCSC
ncbi:unnamed protein product, partial [Mesorhabditis spiculigera]